MPTDDAGQTLVFSFDGTGNEPADADGFKQDESISNVFKLHILLGGGIEPQPPTETRSGRRQMAFYYNGIGTRQDGATIPLLGRLYSAGRRMVNMALAPTFSDVQHILAEAEADLSAAYRPGDKIVVFGFSRGAALARKFVTMLLEADEPRTVAFLGVFDTVAAMGGLISSDVVIEQGALHERVERAVHVVAIDEDRVAFTPTLIDTDAGDVKRVTEIWFPGVHGDVGGGYWNDGLSDLTLGFMAGSCQRTLGGDLIVMDEASTTRTRSSPSGDAVENGTVIAADDVALEPRFDARIHTHTRFDSTLFDRNVREVGAGSHDRPDSLPVLHYSVKQRVDHVADYRPPALRDLDFRLWLGDGRLSPPIRGIGGLRRYRLPWWWRLRKMTFGA